MGREVNGSLGVKLEFGSYLGVILLKYLFIFKDS